MAEVWCEMGGLMEDPEFHWEKIGEAPGNSEEEVYQNLAIQDPDFAEHYSPANPAVGSCHSYWGWRLCIK